MSNIKWLTIVKAAAVLCLVPWVIKLVLANGYALYIGIQTRGEREVISQRLDAMLDSSGFLFITLGMLALIGLWQGYSVAKQTGSAAYIHIGIALVAALVIQSVLGITPGDNLTEIAIGWVVAIVGAVGGVFAAHRQQANLTVQQPSN